jgi:hypothetical protein
VALTACGASAHGTSATTARPPGTLSAIHAALCREGFELLGPDLDGYAHRYERAGLLVDVLAPDGINPPPDLGTGLKAIGVPGGSQASATPAPSKRSPSHS